MTLPIYPGRDLLKGLGYAQKWTPTFFNTTATTATGADIDLGLAQYPLHDFELTYNYLRDAKPGASWGAMLGARAGLEFKTLMGFHLALGGTLGRFLYKNVDDCRVTQQQIGTGDGATTAFTLVRTFGANGYAGTEPVGQVDQTEPFAVYLSESPTPIDPSLYTLSTASPVANTVAFKTAPALGQVITVDMSYFYYCKLAANSATFEKFMDRLWQLQKVTLHSCRPGA